jgi:parallel beta-helix repeat protein
MLSKLIIVRVVIEWAGREMKRISLLVMITISILLATTIPSLIADSAADTTTSSNFLFFDDFDDGSADGWTEYCEESGFWDVISGEYFVTVEIVENGISVVDSLNLTDCVITTKLRFSNSEVGYRAGIVFRYVDNENYYSFEIGNEYDEIDIIKYSSMNPEYGEKRTFIQPSFGNSSIIIDANTDYTLRIEIIGSTFTAFLDDQQVLSWVEETYTIGKVGLRARRADVFFDDFRVSYIPTTVTVPDDYLTIQEAINAANEGDTIFVRNGTYDEFLNVTKGLTILGENVQGTIVYSFEIHADNVTISGFRMHWVPSVGIALYDACYCNISNNKFGSGVYPITLDNSSHNYITNNHIHPVIVNGWGVLLWVNCNANTIRQNSISHSEIGIFIMDSHNNTLDSNELSDNDHFVVIDGGSSNRIYHNNVIDTRYRPSIHGAPDTMWDNGCEGNYWSDYNGTDLDNDGIGDTYLPWEGVDNYPLMNPYWNPGDIDHDLDVDIFDLVRLAAAYGSTASDPNWNPHCDIAEPYGIINIFDIVTIAISYGEEYTI